jgi:hypothetical protein
MNSPRLLVRGLIILLCLLAMAIAIWLSGSYAQAQISLISGRQHLWSGAEAQFTLSISPAQARQNDLSLNWELRTSSATLKHGTSTLSKNQDGSVHATLRMVMPEVRAATKLQLLLRLLKKDKLITDTSIDLRLYPALKKAPLANLFADKKIGVVTAPDGKLSRFLAEQGIEFEVLSSAPAVRAFQGRALLIESDVADQPELVYAALKSVSLGSTAIWLQPFAEPVRGQTSIKLPNIIIRITALDFIPASYLQPILTASGHPALDELSQEDFNDWPDVNSPLPEIGIPPHGNFRGLIQNSGNKGFLLEEMFVGQGRLMLCELPVLQNFTDEPAARLLLEALLRWSLTDPPDFVNAGICAGPDSKLSELVKAVGLLPATQINKQDVLIIDADADSAAYILKQEPAQIDKIRAHLEAGGRCLFIGASADSTAFLERCGLRDIAFLSAPEHHAFTPQPMPLAWGLNLGMLQTADHAGGETLLENVVAPGKEIEEVVGPGVIVKKQVGSGTVILCQFLLAEAPKAPGTGTILRVLLTNLNVRLSEEPESE